MSGFFQGGERPIHMAASNGHVDVIEYLMRERRASVEPVLTVHNTKQYLCMDRYKYEWDVILTDILTGRNKTNSHGIFEWTC